MQFLDSGLKIGKMEKLDAAQPRSYMYFYNTVYMCAKHAQ